MISDFIFCREPLLRFPKKINNPNPSPIGNKFGLFLSGRSGETRTRGLLLPKQARYQLRNTPASGGTAAPPEYSISFFARFVNTESAADGAARSDFFSRQKRQLAIAKKGTAAGTFYGNWVRVWCNCQKADAKTIQSAKLVALQLQAGWKGAIIALYRREA